MKRKRIEPMPGFEELIAFVEQEGTGEDSIPREMFIRLKKLLKKSEQFELEFLLNSIKDGVNAASLQKTETEVEGLNRRLLRLEGSSSNFFLELLFSIIVEFNIIGRIAHALLGSLAPAISRRAMAGTYRINAKFGVPKGGVSSGTISYSKFLNSISNDFDKVVTGHRNFKTMVLGIAMRAVDYQKKTPSTVFGRDTVTAFAGPVNNALGRQAVLRSESQNAQDIHLASNLALVINGGLENNRKDIQEHFNNIFEELELQMEGLAKEPMSMEEFRSLVRLHHYNQDIDSNDINKLVTALLKRVIWTLVLQEGDEKLAEFTRQWLPDMKIPSPNYDFGDANRSRALEALREAGASDAQVAGQPWEFIPNERFLNDKDIIKLLAMEFSIPHKKELKTIYTIAMEEFPEYKSIFNLGQTAEEAKKSNRAVESAYAYLGEERPRHYSAMTGDPRFSIDKTHSDMVSKAREKFMRNAVFSVLNDTAVLLKKHELGDLHWLIINKAWDETVK